MLVMTVIMTIVVISMPRAIGLLTTITHSFLKSLQVLVESVDIQIARRVVKLKNMIISHLRTYKEKRNKRGAYI